MHGQSLEVAVENEMRTFIDCIKYHVFNMMLNDHIVD